MPPSPFPVLYLSLAYINTIVNAIVKRLQRERVIRIYILTTVVLLEGTQACLLHERLTLHCSGGRRPEESTPQQQGTCLNMSFPLQRGFW